MAQVRGDRMSDTKPIIPPHYLADDVTVGELIRWLNRRLMRAYPDNQHEGRRMMELGDGVEIAMAEYRTARDSAQDAPLCIKCRTVMREGVAIAPAMTDHGEAHHIGFAPLSRVWKCPRCGHSFTQHPTIP